MGNINIYLDDVRTPTVPGSNDKDWIIVRNYDEFCQLIDKTDIKDINLISFDHDIGQKSTQDFYDWIDSKEDSHNINYDKIHSEGEMTGLDCARYLIDKFLDGDKEYFPTINVHSANYSGSLNIMSQFISLERVMQKLRVRIYKTVIPYVIINPNEQ